MKKRLLAAVMASILAAVLAGCNYNLIDTTFKFDRAIVSLPDGTLVEGEVESWRDYEDGDQIQVTIDGTTYLVHSANVALIVGEEGGADNE